MLRPKDSGSKCNAEGKPRPDSRSPGNSGDCEPRLVLESAPQNRSKGERSGSLRPVTRADFRKIFEWRNDPEARANSFSSEPVTWEEHTRYWERRLSAGAWSLIFVQEGKDTGLVRLDRIAPGTKAQATKGMEYGPAGRSKGGKEGYEIHILIGAPFRGKGAGTQAIAEAKEFARRHGVPRLIARVKSGNAASRAVFGRNGFRPVHTGEVEVIYELEL